MTVADVVVVGGGICGVSLAARLAPDARVVLLEAADQIGTQATARSAALLVDAYGPPAIRRLTGLSRSFFEHPPAEVSDAPLGRRRGGLVFGRDDQEALLRREYDLARETVAVEWLHGRGVQAVCPILRPEAATFAVLEPNALDLDTHSLLHGFARVLRHHGGSIVTSAPVVRIEAQRDGFRVETPAGTFACATLVNAAGAWADEVAGLARLPPLGLAPMRRTAATVPVPPEIAPSLPRMAFATAVDSSFYFKPEAGTIMVSLSEETLSPPCDAWPDEIDVATALDRFHAATTIPPARPIATWAGLRTFAPDRAPVVGLDPRLPGFFWYAGQGGYGIQTSPALSALGAKVIRGAALAGVDASLAAALAASRLMIPAATEPVRGRTVGASA